MSFGPGGLFVLDQPLRFAAGATLGIELADLAVSLVEGSASIDHLSASAQGDQPVVLADLELIAPRLSADRFGLDATPAGAIVRVTNLVFSTDRVTHVPDPHWQLEGLSPSLPDVEGRLGRANGAMVVEQASVRGLSLVAQRGSYRSRDGFSITGDRAHIQATLLSTQELVGGVIDIGGGTLSLDVADNGSRTTGRTGYRDFHVTASGGKDRLVGNGSLHLDDVKVDHEFPVLGDKCGDRLRLRASLGIGGVDLSLALRDSELHGDAAAHGVGLRLLDTAARKCEWNESYQVDVVEVITESVCWIPLIGDAICDLVRRNVKVPVRVPVRWLALASHVDVSGSIDRVDLSLRGNGGVGFCVHGAKMQPGGIQEVSVGPTFEARGDLGELVKNVYDEVWRRTVGSLQSALATSITNIAGVVTSISPVEHCN
jgi:hypothetical protein